MTEELRRPRWMARYSMQLSLIALASAAATYGRTAVGPLQESIKISLVLSDNQMALLQGAALAFPQVLAGIPFGLLADRWSRARLLLAVTALNITGSVLTAVASSFAALFAARCLVGLAVAAAAPAALSLIADLYVSGQRGRATMIVHIGGVAGMSAAFALGGALLGPLATNTGGWRTAMVGLTMPLVFVLPLMGLLREPSRAAVAIVKPSTREAFAQLWHVRTAIGPLMVGWVMVTVGDMAAMVWGAPTLSRTFGLEPNHIGEIMATVLLVSGLFGPVLGGTLADICQGGGGPRRTVSALALLALLSAFAALFPTVTGVVPASLLLCLFITIGAAIGTMTMTLSIVVIPSELRGLCIALYTVVGGAFGIGLAPLLVSAVSGAIGGPEMIGTALMMLCVATAVLGTTGFALAARYQPTLIELSR